MRKDWEVKAIGDIAKISDYVANGSFATLKENVQYLKEKGYAVLVRYADYTNNFDSKKFVYVNESAYNFLEKSKLFGGEIIMSNVGSVGKLFICPKLGEYMSLAPNSILIRTDNNSFFYYYFSSDAFQRKINEITSKTALPKFNKTSFKKIKLSIPPLQTQQQIVEELDCLTSIIEKQKKQLEELDNLAQSIFYDMFGDPIENEKGWDIKKLGDLCISDLGKTLNKSKDTGNSLPYLCSINIQWNYIDLSVKKEAQFEENEINKYSVFKGDLLVCEGGDIGRAAIWKEDYSMLYQNALHRIRFDKNIIAEYVLYFLWRLKQKGILDTRYAKGVTIKHLVKSSLLSINIPVPPLSLQQQFASKIEAIEKQKELIKKSIKETEDLFNSRMDYYFN